MAPALKPCGTHAAYARHRARGEEPCQPCREAERSYQRGEVRSPRPADVCGTRAGYQRHRYRREQACLACCDAAAEYVRQRREEQKRKRAASAAAHVGAPAGARS